MRSVSTLLHARLGGSELEVSRIALGSWRTFERMPRDAAESLLAYALDRGIDFLDDARYDDETGRAPIPSGYSEVLFGELFRATAASRNAIKVSNKLWWEFWPEQDAVSELEASLERMDFQRLDLLYSSTLPDELAVPVAVEQIAAVLATGRIGAWAVVNWSATALDAAAREAARLGIAPPCAAQLPYSLAQLDWVESPEMIAALSRSGASLVPSAVLAGGALSGKYSGRQADSGRLSGELGDDRHRHALRVAERLVPLAAALGAEPATVATAFALANPQTACTLVGATQPGQIDQALAAIELVDQLTAEQRQALRGAAAP
jgi:L-glyceraldehyde 3-phosphate reductase